MVWPASIGSARILVGELLQGLRHECLARHLAHGAEHQGIENAARLEMPRHHKGAVARVHVSVTGGLALGMAMKAKLSSKAVRSP